MFEQATRGQFRFSSARGAITTEDLWQLPLSGVFSLNEVAKQLSRDLKQVEEEDFVAKRKVSDEILQVKLDIVKHIIAVKLAEQEDNKQAANKRAQREKILGILARKQENTLEEKTEEELKEMLKDL